jgi:ABC-type glycerol-3-phosphate transport system substrate-binding protein
LEFDVAEFPMSPAGKKGWSTGGSGFAMCKAGKHKELAWKVIKALTSADSLSKMAATGFIQPALMTLSKSNVFLKSPGPAHKSILLEMPKYSHYSPFMANWGEITAGALGPVMDPVWLGTKTPEEVLPVICKTINEKYFQKK